LVKKEKTKLELNNYKNLLGILSTHAALVWCTSIRLVQYVLFVSWTAIRGAGNYLNLKSKDTDFSRNSTKNAFFFTHLVLSSCDSHQVIPLK